MKSKLKKYGYNPLVVIAVIGALIAVGAVAFVMSQQKANNQSANTTAQKSSDEQKKPAVDMKACEKKQDKEICRFLENWQKKDKYRITARSPGQGTYIYSTNGKDTYTKVANASPYEIITIGAKSIYIKGGDTWYKQTTGDAGDGNDRANSAVGVGDSPGGSGVIDIDGAPTYKLVGKEACGELMCFKYESVRDGATSTIWFDDKDYKARRAISEIGGNKSEANFEYVNIAIDAPTSFKDLAPDEYIIPGQAAPTKKPAAQNQ